MKRNLTFLLCLNILGATTAMAQDITYEGGYTQGAGNNKTYAWGGPTTSTVTATMKTDLNSVGEQVVVFETYDQPYQSYKWQSGTETFSVERRVRWHKNGGHTGSNTDNANSFVGWVKLSFSNPVPANEIFIRLYDMDNRGVDSIEPDGYVRFPGSEATPTDFDQLVMSPAAPSNATSSTYNDDGSITFGVGAANADRNKYLGLVGKNDKKVSEISIFMRNIGDDVGIEVGWLKPTKKTALPVTILSFDASEAPDGVQLEWRTADEKDFDRFEIEQSATPQRGFNKIGEVKGGRSRYTFVDVAADRNTPGYYRLKMIDIDGTYSYSRIVNIGSSNGQELAKIYPNPSSGRTVYLNSPWAIDSYKVYDAVGRQMQVQMAKQPGRYEFTFAQNAQPGTYIVAYKTGGRMASQRFVLTH